MQVVSADCYGTLERPPTWSQQKAGSQQGFPLVKHVSKDSIEEGRIKGPLRRMAHTCSEALLWTAAKTHAGLRALTTETDAASGVAGDTNVSW